MARDTSQPPKNKWSGRVILGPDDGTGRAEARITDIEGQRAQSWTEATEAEYMHRVSSKAAVRAQKMLETAQAQAEDILRQAREEGLKQGQDHACKEVESRLASMGGQMEQLLDRLEAAGHELWTEHREDLVSLVQLAVEKITGLELAERRQDSLYAVLDQAVEHLETQRGLVIRAHPEDHELLQELMQQIKEHHPGLERWKLRADPSVSPGGLVLESEHGMVDNTLESRRARVAALLDQLILPDGVSGEPGDTV